jgi:hypothetical protein
MLLNVQWVDLKRRQDPLRRLLRMAGKAMVKRCSPPCEFRVDGRWVCVTADEAHHAHRGKPKRCPSCHGTVITAGSYTSEPRISLQH